MPQSPALTAVQKKLQEVLDAYPEPPSILMQQGNIGDERFARKSAEFWQAQKEWEKHFVAWGELAQPFADQRLIMPPQRSAMNQMMAQWMCPPLRLGELLQSVGWSGDQAAKFHVNPLCLQSEFRGVVLYRGHVDAMISQHIDCMTQLLGTCPDAASQSKLVRKIVDGGAHLAWRCGRLFEGGMRWDGANRWMVQAKKQPWWSEVGKGFWKGFDDMCSEDLIQNHLNLKPLHPFEKEHQMNSLKKALEHEDFHTFLKLVPEPPAEAKGFLNLMHGMCGLNAVYPPQDTVMRTQWLNQHMWDTNMVDPDVRMIFESLQSKKILGEALDPQLGVKAMGRKI